MRYAMITDVGNVRKNNEDSMLVCQRDFGKTQAVLAAVADGMGGLSHGERASRYVADGLRQWWETEIRPLAAAPDMGHVGDTLGFLFEKMQVGLRQQIKDQHTNMGTTLSLVFILGGEYIIKQVGDSRVYLIDKKKCYQLTKDQTWCQQEIDAGRMGEDEARVHENRHMLINAFGAGEDFFVQEQRGQFHKKQRILLCSDGYYSYFVPKELSRRFGVSLKRALAASVKRIKAGRAEDNLTAVLIER